MSQNQPSIPRYRTLTIAITVIILILLPLIYHLNPTISLLAPPHHRPAAMGDQPLGSCPPNPPLDTSKRTSFGTRGCTVYGHPSSGGILILEADTVDMRFLSLDRFAASRRSSNVVAEDGFCNRMRMLGAGWWAEEQEWIDVQLGLRARTALEGRRLVFGWPTGDGGGGVWVLRYGSEREVPRDFGKMALAVDMDERCRVMRGYGAVFYEDPGRVEELEGWL